MAPNCEVKTEDFLLLPVRSRIFHETSKLFGTRNVTKNFYKFCQNAFKVMDPEFGN